MKEKFRPRVFKSRMLRKIFRPKRDEGIKEWRRLHNKELYAHYSSPYIIRVIKSRRLRWAGHVAHMVESRGAYRILVGKPEERRPLERPKRRWEDNIKMDLTDVAWDGMEWIDLAQDRESWRALVNEVVNLRIAPNAGNFLSTWRTADFSRRPLLRGITVVLVVVVIVVVEVVVVVVVVKVIILYNCWDIIAQPLLKSEHKLTVR